MDPSWVQDFGSKPTTPHVHRATGIFYLPILERKTANENPLKISMKIGSMILSFLVTPKSSGRTVIGRVVGKVFKSQLYGKWPRKHPSRPNFPPRSFYKTHGFSSTDRRTTTSTPEVSALVGGRTPSHSGKMWQLKGMVTPWKINMEPENDGLEDNFPFQLGDS